MLYLEDFVVRESERGLGIGKLLFEAFLEEAKKLDVSLVKWQVLDWNEPAIHFYKKYDVDFDRLKNFWGRGNFLKIWARIRVLFDNRRAY